jgi:hypothetical protein
MAGIKCGPCWCVNGVKTLCEALPTTQDAILTSTLDSGKTLQTYLSFLISNAGV